MRSRAGLPICCFALTLLLAGSAQAQHGLVPPDDRPLHERLAEARLVAFATVVRVDPGRVALEQAVPILGEVPEAFELKRSPSKPPSWLPGDRALLLLSGARSPYRWVERPAEIVAIPDAAAEARWREALRALSAARTDPAARRDLYARWCDGPADDLAEAGVRGLSDLGALPTLNDSFAIARARVAADPGRPLAVRRRAARVAVRHPSGVEAMLDHLAATAPDTDPKIAEAALQAGILIRSPALEAGIVEALKWPEGELGRIGLRLAGLAGGDDVERRLAELVVGHPDADVRDDASRALKRLRSRREDG